MSTQTTTDTLVTIETSGPGERYTLTETGPNLSVHVAPEVRGGVGPIVCGFDRFARGEDGRLAVGFSVAGGTRGPSTKHRICPDCARLVAGRPIRGLHADLVEAEVELQQARLTVASLAISATSTDAEAVEAMRDVLDMLGIGGAA